MHILEDFQVDKLFRVGRFCGHEVDCTSSSEFSLLTGE